MKKVLTVVLTAALLLIFGVPVLAAGGSVSTLEASATTTAVTVSGTTDTNIAAVMVEVLKGSDSLAYYSFEVSSSKTFSGTISGLSLTSGEKYTVRAADYDGGSWKSMEVTAKGSTPSGGSSSGGTSSGSSTSTTTTTTTETAATETSNPAQTATEKPASQTSVSNTPEVTPVPATVTSEEPKTIENVPVKEEVTLSSDSEEAWNDVADAVDQAFEESLASAGLSEEEIEAIMESGELGSDVLETPVEVVVEMGETTELNATILEKIQGKNVDLVLDMGNGIKWTINGNNVTGTNLANINLEVTVGETDIPEETINELAEGKPVVNISLTHDGEFGFDATLTIDLGTEYAGQYANLYYFDPEKGYQFMGSYPVKADGTSDLAFSHASEYSIVMTAEPVAEATSANEDIASPELKPVSAPEAVATASSSNAPVRIIVIGIVAVLIIAGIVVFVKKKSDEE